MSVDDDWTRTLTAILTRVLRPIELEGKLRLLVAAQDSQRFLKSTPRPFQNTAGVEQSHVDDVDGAQPRNELRDFSFPVHSFQVLENHSHRHSPSFESVGGISRGGEIAAHKLAHARESAPNQAADGEEQMQRPPQEPVDDVMHCGAVVDHRIPIASCARSLARLSLRLCPRHSS
ncbi:hypothetical protein Mapa_011023 [Marchantia paleacea]|nr:hypothetical protein Mapa_011023 [Marchantia paleacea]